MLDIAGDIDGMTPIETAVTCKANDVLMTDLWAICSKDQQRRGNLATACVAFKEQHWSLALSTLSTDPTIAQAKYDGVRLLSDRLRLRLFCNKSCRLTVAYCMRMRFLTCRHTRYTTHVRPLDVLPW